MTETQHQCNVIKWSQQPSIRAKYPELKLLHHVKNETTEGAKRVSIDSALGVKKGVPDLFLPSAHGKYHGLYIEMKTENGRASQAQLWWIEELNKAGYFTEVCRGWKSAIRLLEWYLSL